MKNALCKMILNCPEHKDFEFKLQVTSGDPGDLSCRQLRLYAKYSPSVGSTGPSVVGEKIVDLETLILNYAKTTVLNEEMVGLLDALQRDSVGT